MKYKVSVIKKIAFLVMTMALAVAMVACESATGAQGDLGPQGDPGEQGPSGAPGTSDNNSPVSVKPLEMAYVALGGTGATPGKKTAGIALSDYFMDDETPTLEYKFESSAKDVAEAKLESGKMVVVGKKAGTATITVKVFDNVSAPIDGTFDVTVVNDNALPTVTALIPADDNADTTTDGDKLGAKLYVSRGASKVTVTSTVNPGTAAGVVDEVTYNVAMGMAGGADDIAKVSVEDGSKAGTLDITLDPMKSGKQNVRITVKDKFGTEAATRLDFVVLVNTPPKLANKLPDIVLVEDVDSGNTISIVQYFDTTEKVPTAGPIMENADNDAATPLTPEAAPAAEDPDTVCTYSTSPVQAAAAITTAPDPITHRGTLTIVTDNTASYQLSIRCADAEDEALGAAMVTIRTSGT